MDEGAATEMQRGITTNEKIWNSAKRMRCICMHQEGEI